MTTTHEETLVAYDKANAARQKAQKEFIEAHRALTKAIGEEVTAIAKEAAARDVPLLKFVKACASNAKSFSATSSGGAHDAYNVVEALSRDAWIQAADDVHLSFLFKQEQ